LGLRDASRFARGSSKYAFEGIRSVARVRMDEGAAPESRPIQQFPDKEYCLPIAPCVAAFTAIFSICSSIVLSQMNIRRDGMKSVRNASVSLAMIAACQLAHAQSTVTLYGVLDESIQYVHNTAGQQNQISMQQGNWLLSRWGVTGSEDIGNGTKVIFTLESGFNLNNGAFASSNQIFNRAAYVGFSNPHYGDFTFGRQLNIMYTVITPVQCNWYYGFCAAPGDVDMADGGIRLNNAATWMSPVWSGLQLAAQYSFGNVAGSVGSDQTYSLAASYTSSTLKAAAGYIHIDNGNPVGSVRGTGNNGTIFFSAVNAAYMTASSYDVARAAASYTIGSVTLGGYYSFSEYVADGYSVFKKSERYNNASLYAYWMMTPAWSSEFAVDYMRSRGDSSATYKTAVASLGYSLSKTTQLYASVAYGHAAGQNGAGVAQAVIGDSWAAAGASWQTLAFVGIDHRF
jgi:predicted porin